MVSISTTPQEFALKLKGFLTGALALVLASAAPLGRPHAEPAQAVSLNLVKNDVLAATGYDDRTVELTATEVQLVVTIVNSKLISRPAIERENEGYRIVMTIAHSIADKPEFKGIQGIHVDYVKREAGSDHSERVDGIDFRKDPDGNFRHHIT
jgi:hypothetical protein